MKIKVSIFLIIIACSCNANKSNNIDGHWHIIDGQIYQTIDVKKEHGNMNKNISGIIHYDISIDTNLKTLKYFLGGNDTLFNYQLNEDTLLITSIKFGREYKATKIKNCKPVNDWFYLSPLELKIPVSDKPYGKEIEKRSLALELVVGEVNEEIKFCIWDSISNDPKDLEKFYNKLTSAIPENMSDQVFVDIYLNRDIKIRKLKWLIEKLYQVGFSKTYIVFEFDKSQKTTYRKTEITLEQLNHFTVQEFVLQKK